MRGHDAFLLAPFAVAAVLIVVAASVFFSGNACRGSTIGQDTPKGEKSPPPQTDRLRKLLTEQRDTLQQLRPLIRALYTTGVVAFGRVLEVERRLLTSELDLAETQEERIRILERILKERSALEDLTRMRFDAQLVPAVDYLNGKALRLDVAIRLEREKAEDQKTPAPRTKNVRMLGKEYSDTLGQVVTGLETMFRTGLVDLEDVHQAKTSLLNAEFDLAETQEQRIRLLQRTVKERSAWEKLLRDRVAAQFRSLASCWRCLRNRGDQRASRGEQAGGWIPGS